jgi:molecular chaperone DnaJ
VGSSGGRGGGGGGGGGPPPGPRRGADLETRVALSFEEALNGTTVPVTIDGPAVCSRCHGSGAEPGTDPVTCPRCGGRGEIAENQGFFSMTRMCPQCGGAGRIVETPCTRCGGSGSERWKRTLNVRIPPGVRDGARIKAGGKGEPGLGGGAPGDLFVRVSVEPHELFGRKGDDLVVELPVSFPEAALGAQVQVPTLDGSVTLKIPAGTPTGKTFRVRGRGAPRKGGHGDLLVKVKVDVPEKLSRDERELVKQLREASKESPRKRLGVS